MKLLMENGALAGKIDIHRLIENGWQVKCNNCKFAFIAYGEFEAAIFPNTINSREQGQLYKNGELIGFFFDNLKLEYMMKSGVQ